MSLAFGQAAGKAGIARAMGSRGDCHDDLPSATAGFALGQPLRQVSRRRTCSSSRVTSFTRARASSTAAADRTRRIPHRCRSRRASCAYTWHAFSELVKRWSFAGQVASP